MNSTSVSLYFRNKTSVVVAVPDETEFMQALVDTVSKCRGGRSILVWTARDGRHLWIDCDQLDLVASETRLNPVPVTPQVAR